jgi:hypothetical protein
MHSQPLRGSNRPIGLVLIVLGLVFFAITQGLISWDWLNLNWSVLWPAVTILLGGAIFAGAFTRVGQTRTAAATFGAMVVLLGLFFFATTLGYLAWEDQGRLWPIYPLSLGLALLVGYVVSGQQDRSYLISGLAVGVISLILLAITVTQTYLYVTQVWPIALIIVGVLLIMLRPDRTLRRR